MYEKYIKRLFDIVLSLGGLVVLSPVYLILCITVRVKLGSPVLFRQDRPGKDEKIFKLCKFRTMTDQRDENGNLLPDDVRLTEFGKFLRSTSLDELPELINILKGEMSVVGPRPQLVRDMVFMTDEERTRHDVKPGLTGLAQVSGRNAIAWERKLQYDLEYIEKLSFKEDVKILFKTVLKVFEREGISDGENATAEDLGDYLLRVGKIDEIQYAKGQDESKELLKAVSK